MSKGSTTIHVGAKRFGVLADLAIDISHANRKQITPSQVIHHLIDNFTEEDKKRITESLGRQKP